MEIKRLIKEISKLKNCKIKEPEGLPIVEKHHFLPNDLKEFYEICGGIDLFENESFSFSIVSPKEFILSNPIIVGELCKEDISSEWYIIAKDRNNDYISIDLNSKRLGRCYDSFWDRHGVVGVCSVISLSFADFLYNLLLSKGLSYFWLEDNFKGYGDAYDETP